MKLTINGQTGAPLEALLREMMFTVPEIQPYEPLPEPPYMAPPVWPGTSDPAARAQWKIDFMAYQTYVKNRGAIRLQNQAENTQRLNDYFQQFENFALYLAEIFDPLENYTFLQAAYRLMGYACTRPDRPINFICYQFK